MAALAAIGTVICRVEVASDPPRLLLVLCGDSPAGSLHTEVTSSSLKLTRRTDDPPDFFTGVLTGVSSAAGLLFAAADSVLAGKVGGAAAAAAAAAAALAVAAEEAEAAAAALSRAVRLAEGEMFGVG